MSARPHTDLRAELLGPGPYIVTRSAAQDRIAERCTEIADQVVPKYRHAKRTYSCTGYIAHEWQAAWDAACIALGGNPADYRG